MSGERSFFVGAQDPASDLTDLHSLTFLARQLIALISTATLVQVQKVTNTPGQVAPIGRVDVLPLVNQVDGLGNATPHEVVGGLPYSRLAGGGNAILMDPEQGDIGLVMFAGSDISSVLAKSPAGNKGNAQANPGSRRRHDMQDGVYVSLTRGPAPGTYIAFTSPGITIVDTFGNKMVFGAEGVNVNGALITLDGDVITKHGTSLDHHVNTQVMSGSSDTGPPP